LILTKIIEIAPTRS